VRRTAKGRAGITLIEMLIVVALVSLLAGVSFPAIGAGLESLRLVSAANQVAAFFNTALNRAERRQQVVQVLVLPQQGLLRMRSTEPGFERTLELSEGVRIAAVLPERPYREEQGRSFLLLPGGVAPRVTIVLGNRRGGRRLVSLDPITGAPHIEVPQSEQ